MGALVNHADTSLTRAQRWAQVAVLIAAFAGMTVGLLIKAQVVGGTQFYRDRTAGITAQYPVNWLLDTEGDYIFRVSDPRISGFLTSFQVAVVPNGEGTARNVADQLTLERGNTLTGYQVLSVRDAPLPDGEPATRLEYFFVEVGSDPFLERSPVTVHGIDVIAIKRGQVVIITFQADNDRFEQELDRFEQFLVALEF